MPRKNKYKQRADGRYEAKIQIGYKDNGRPNRVTVYGTSSSELEKKVNALRYEVDHGKYVSDKNTTLESYANTWLETYKSGKAKNTQAVYRNIIKKHINCEIGHIRIGDVSTTHVQRLINTRIEHYRTCEQIRNTLSQIFRAAINDGLVYKNPCTGVELPKAPKSTKRALTDTETQAIKTAAFSDKERAFIYILYCCGLRRGETLALTKADINFSTGIITVNKSAAFDDNNTYIKEPKSESGYRDVDMPDFLISFLKEYMKGIDILLFPMKNGEQMTKSSYARMWKSIVKKINAAAGGTDSCQVVSGLTAHIFRHNYCTMLYYSGISIKKACELMGHADTKMIMDVYAHLDDKKERTREKINQAIAL